MVNPQLLTGTWPLRMHTDQFYGSVHADGQRPRVAALACHQGDVVALSLVGYDTSVSASLARLWLRESVPLELNAGIRWEGPRHLKRRADAYKQFSTQLTGTKEWHYLALPASAHIAEGIFHPPDLPAPPKKAETPEEKAGMRRAPVSEQPKIDRSRFVLGNFQEDVPHERSFLGTLYGMRVLFLHKSADHPDWPHIWASELWERGNKRKLIQPLKQVLGCKAWVLAGDLLTWGKLVGDGTREGWLPGGEPLLGAFQKAVLADETVSLSEACTLVLASS